MWHLIRTRIIHTARQSKHVTILKIVTREHVKLVVRLTVLMWHLIRTRIIHTVRQSKRVTIRRIATPERVRHVM